MEKNQRKVFLLIGKDDKILLGEEFAHRSISFGFYLEMNPKLRLELVSKLGKERRMALFFVFMDDGSEPDF
jgi:hypothetical protein